MFWIYGAGGLGKPAGFGGGGGLRNLPFAVHEDNEDIIMATIITIANGFSKCPEFIFIFNIF